MSEELELEHEKLVELIRRIAKEVCYEILDQHCSVCHKKQPAKEVETQ